MGALRVSVIVHLVALTPKFWYLAFSPCQRSPTFSCLLSPCQSPPFLWSLPYEYIGFKVVNSISFLIIKLQKYVKENALKLLMTSSSELSWSCTWLKAGWLLGVCQPKKGMIWDCLFACSLIWVLGHAMVLEWAILCLYFLRVLIRLLILLSNYIVGLGFEQVFPIITPLRYCD